MPNLSNIHGEALVSKPRRSSTAINFFDLRYNIMQSPGRKNVLRVTSANELCSKDEWHRYALGLEVLATASVEDLFNMQSGLINLKALSHSINVSRLTGNVDETAVSYDLIHEPGFLSEDMNPTTANHLKAWAKHMSTYNSKATMILTDILKQNKGLSDVCLQFQPCHDIPEILTTLGSLTKLKKLEIKGSDIWRARHDPSHRPTETILYILESCKNLKEFRYQAIPTSQAIPSLHNASFVSSITKLDFSMFNKSPYHGQVLKALPIQTYRIVQHCPNLKWLALQQHLSQEDMISLNPTLSQSCRGLEYLAFHESCLNVPEFPNFMAMLTSLKRLAIYHCVFMAKNFIPWARCDSSRLLSVEVKPLEKYRDQAHQMFVMLREHGRITESSESMIWEGRSSYL
ncbi:MAG: hypothetical protein J3Q66DRAFT_321618 [Benniella sp.]|nr:MAG: hypothetical protein J3Q66DRAFT_321618 [Benniella sp.]